MASNAVLELILKLKDEASGELKQIQGSLGGVNKAALALGGAAVIGVGALAKGLWDCVDAAGEEEIGIAKLKTAIDASGTSYDSVSGSIEAYIAAATRKTAFDDGAQRESLSRLVMMTGDYNTALGLMPLAMDLARAKDIELSAAAEIVGKVHEGNTGILSRYGIVLKDGATSQEALAAMQAQFSGQAEAYGSTFAGAQDKMGIALGNLKETIGAAVLPILTSFISMLADLATEAIPMIDGAITALRPVFETVWGAIKAAVDAVLPPMQAMITAAMPIIQTAWDTAWTAIKVVVETVWPVMQNIIETVLGVIKGIINGWTAALSGDWQGVWDAILGIISTVWNGIKTHIELILPLIQAAINLAWGAIQTAAQTAWDAIKSVISDVWDGIVGAVKGKVDDVRLAMGNAWNTIHGAAVRAFNAIKTAILTPIQEAKGAIDGLISGIISAWQRLGSFHIPLPHFRAGTRDVSVAGISFPIPDIGIDWYGKGMPTTVFDKPTMIGVGERGPEAVSVTPLRGGAAGATGGAGGGVTITGNTFIVRSDQDIERIARAIYQQMMAQTGQRIALGQGVYVP